MKLKLLMAIALMNILAMSNAMAGTMNPIKEAWVCRSKNCHTWEGFSKCQRKKDAGHSMMRHHPNCSKAFFEHVCKSKDACRSNGEEIFWCRKLAHELKRENDIEACNQNIKSYCEEHADTPTCKMDREESKK